MFYRYKDQSRQFYEPRIGTSVWKGNQTGWWSWYGNTNGVYIFDGPRKHVHLLEQLVDVSNNPAIRTEGRGGSRIFIRRGCTRLLLYFNTNKPHIYFLAEYQLY